MNGAPAIYGIYFGHCTTGSLDRAISGSCGARISKDVFLDFCRQAKEQNVDLPSCDSELLDNSKSECSVLGETISLQDSPLYS